MAQSMSGITFLLCISLVQETLDSQRFPSHSRRLPSNQHDHILGGAALLMYGADTYNEASTCCLYRPEIIRTRHPQRETVQIESGRCK